MKTTQVTVVRSTAKAHLVADQAGREGWIQQRWLRADGTVSTATFEKAVANTAERQAQRKGLFRFLSSGAK